MTTHAAYGDASNLQVQAAGLFMQHQNRNSKMQRMRGMMPKGEAKAAQVLKAQTTPEMPIVQSMDLGAHKGDEIKFHLVQPVGAYPVMGSEIAQGRGTPISIDEIRLRVNQARFPISAGDTMTQIRSPVDFIKLGRPIAQSLMDAYIDQQCLIQMAGARGFHDNLEWKVPLASNSRFDEIMINPVKAPTYNRHFVADGTAVTHVVPNAGDLTITTGDVLDMAIVDAMRSTLDQLALPPPMVRIEGDQQAEDDPLRIWLMSPAQYNSFASDSSFRAYQSAALARARDAKDHPLFRTEAGLWGGFLIMKMPRPIRFYAGDTYLYCASADSETESSLTIPAAFGTTYAVDRSVIIGGSAVAEALAAHPRSGAPFFFSTKTEDFDDKTEIMIGAVRAAQKIRWHINTGNGYEYTDNVIAVDSAVPISGVGA